MMSVQAMGRVWDLDLPHAERLVLLALADHADHQGNNIYPSIGLIAWKTGYSERQVKRIIKQLVDIKLLTVKQEGGGRGRATPYRFDLCAGSVKAPYEKGDKMAPIISNGDKMTPFADNGAILSPITHQETVTSATTNGDISDRKGDIAVSPQPLKPLINQHKTKQQQQPLVSDEPPKEKRTLEWYRAEMTKRYGDD